MLHSRKDYMHIQDNTGKVADNEPVFLLRAKDTLAPDIVRKWADLLESLDGDKIAIKAAREHAALMENWQKIYGSKKPDTPSEAVL